jgi:hypothetical protein
LERPLVIRGEEKDGMHRTRHLRLIVSVVTVSVVLLAGTAVWLTHSPKAHANQTTPPPYSHSWYVNNMTNVGNHPTGGCYPSSSALYNQGCTDGAWDNQNCTNSLVVLDFGQPDMYGGAYGTNIFGNGNPFYDDAHILLAAQDYAYGWYHATGSCPHLRLALGTNNYHECVHGCNLTTWGSNTSFH